MEEVEQEEAVAEPEPPNMLQHLREQVDFVTDKMKSNMEKIIERGEKADDLLYRTRDVEEGTKLLRYSGRSVQRSFCWRNCKLIVLLVGVGLVIVLIVFLLVKFIPNSSSNHIPIPVPVPAPGPGTTTVSPTTKL
ncbi:vesicle-associated membrane protein 3-like [Pholidichthys leucotaenia]